MTEQTMAQVVELLAEHDPAGELAPCPVRSILLGERLLEQLPEVLAGLLPGLDRRTGVVLLGDPTSIGRDGEDVEELVVDALAPHCDVRRVVLDDGHPELHVAEDVVAAARTATEGAEVVIALGGGTISDIGKAATAGRRPAQLLVSVQTAASVDGYTDDVSVVLRDGVKRTEPTRWPDVVVADTAVVAQAPERMTRAGFGEMTSMLTAPADWRLASLVGTEQHFHPAPLRLLEDVGQGLLGWAEGVGSGDPVAVASLTRALAVRGVVTGVAGTTATLSGVEHLVSHMLDLHHASVGSPMGLHGAQVGVGAVVAATVWERLLARMAAERPARLHEDQLDEAVARARVERAFGHLGAAVVQECWTDYAAKLGAVRERREEVESLLGDWSTHAAGLRDLVRPAEEVARALRSARAALTFEDLRPVVDPALARWAVSHCALMRKRFTAVDLLTLLGWWTPDDVDEVLAQSAATVAATQEAGAR